MKKGYLLAASNALSDAYPTSSAQCWFTNGYWWCIARDNLSDWYIWKKDSATPGTHGTAGGWTNTGHMVEGRTTAYATIAWDEASQALHVLGYHATEYYNKWTYNSGTDAWTNTIVNEDTGITVVGSNSRCDMAVDSNGIVVIIDAGTNANIDFYYRDTDNTWKSGNPLETGATIAFSELRVAVFPFVDGSGNPNIGAFYGYEGSGATNGWRFAYMPDSAAKASAAWTTELAVATNGSSFRPDDHVHAVAYVKSGETASTIVAVFKESPGGGVCHAVVRSSSGSWGTHVNFGETNATRPKVIVDATNNKFRVVWEEETGAATSHSFREANVVASPSFGPRGTWLAAEGTVNFDALPGVPDHACTSTTGWLWYCGASTDGAWWNEEEIPVASSTPKWKKGFNFRATAGYVTDGAGETYSIGAIYPERRNDVTFGWDLGLGSTVHDRTTSSPNAPKLSGVNYVATGDTARYFQIDLPATGTYRIRLAAGDAGSGNRPYWEIRDTTVLLTSQSQVSTASDQYYDAAGNLHTSPQNWLDNNESIDLTFTTTIFRFWLLVPTELSSIIAHLEIEYLEEKAHDAVPLNDNNLLVRYYFDEAPSGQGITTISDASGNGLHMDDIDYNTTAMQWTVDSRGNRGLQSTTNTQAQYALRSLTAKAVATNSTGGIRRASNAPSYSSFTIAGWAYISSGVQGNGWASYVQGLFDSVTGNGNGINFRASDSVLCLNSTAFTPSVNATATSAYSFVYFALTGSGTTLNGYLYTYNNGIFTLSHTATITANAVSADTVCIGNAGAFYTDRQAAGRYTYTRVWNVALSQSEIEAEILALQAVRTSGLLMDWPLQGHLDTSDLSGNSYIPTLLSPTTDAGPYALTSFGRRVDGGTKFTVEMVYDDVFGSASNGRIFCINDRAADNPTLGFSHYTGASGPFRLWFYDGLGYHFLGINAPGAGRKVIHGVVDTTLSNVADRMRIYINGVRASVASYPTNPDQNATCSFYTPARPAYDLILFNRWDGTTHLRSPEGTIYYGAIYDDAFSDKRCFDHYRALALDDDTPPGDAGPLARRPQARELFASGYTADANLGTANAGSGKWTQTNNWVGSVGWDNTNGGVVATAGDLGTCYWTGDTFLDDQYAEMRLDIVSLANVGGYLGPIVRSSADTYADAVDNRKFYMLAMSLDASASPYTLKMSKYVNGIETPLASAKIFSWADGDILTLEAVGGVITGKVNGVIPEGFQVVDPSPLTGGRPGLCAQQSTLGGYYHGGAFEAGNIFTESAVLPTRVQVASDDFSGGVEDPITGDWLNLDNWGGNIQQTTDGLFGCNISNTPGYAGMARRQTETYSADQYSEVEIAGALPYQTWQYYVGAMVRCSEDQNSGAYNACDGYFAVVASNNGTSPYGTRIGKVVNGIATTLGEINLPWALGDRIGIEVFGSVIRATKNGEYIGGPLVYTDTDLTTGNPGIICGGDLAGIRGDNWTGGNMLPTGIRVLPYPRPNIVSESFRWSDGTTALTDYSTRGWFGNKGGGYAAKSNAGGGYIGANATSDKILCYQREFGEYQFAEATIASVGSQDFYLCGYIKDWTYSSYTYYVGGFYGNYAYFGKFLNGGWTSFGDTTAITPTAGQRLRVEFRPGSQKLYLDGNLLLQEFDTSISGGGRIGMHLFTQDTGFRDFVGGDLGVVGDSLGPVRINDFSLLHQMFYYGYVPTTPAEVQEYLRWSGITNAHRAILVR